jgi:hypothetical protein
MSNLPTIPEFTNDLASIATALRAIKQSVEIIAGQRQGDSLGAPQMFVQENEPRVSRSVSFKRGDLWINTFTKRLHYWTGQFWEELL